MILRVTSVETEVTVYKEPWRQLVRPNRAIDRVRLQPPRNLKEADDADVGFASVLLLLQVGATKCNR